MSEPADTNRSWPTSLGFRTDLMLLRLQGSEVEDRGDHLVVRTVSNPEFWWGNFLLLRQPLVGGQLGRWMTVFADALPQARHVSLGIDGKHGNVGDPAAEEELREAGLTIDRSAVLTTARVRPPPRPNERAVCRPLSTDDDWAAASRLWIANHYTHEPTASLGFVARRLSVMRRLQEAGHGAWWGAFVDAEMRCGLGVFGNGTGLVRYQSVDTHPDWRGQGLAGTLVHAAGAYALDAMHARTLVMVADPEYVAARVYRSVGFVDTETMVQLQRAPAGEQTAATG